MFCNNCGKEIKNTDKYCPECGNILYVTCKKCGALINNTYKFCADCGEPLISQDEIVNNEIGKVKLYATNSKLGDNNVVLDKYIPLTEEHLDENNEQDESAHKQFKKTGWYHIAIFASFISIFGGIIVIMESYSYYNKVSIFTEGAIPRIIVFGILIGIIWIFNGIVMLRFSHRSLVCLATGFLYVICVMVIKEPAIALYPDAVYFSNMSVVLFLVFMAYSLTSLIHFQGIQGIWEKPWFAWPLMIIMTATALSSSNDKIIELKVKREKYFDDIAKQSSEELVRYYNELFGLDNNLVKETTGVSNNLFDSNKNNSVSDKDYNQNTYNFIIIDDAGVMSDINEWEYQKLSAVGDYYSDLLQIDICIITTNTIGYGSGDDLNQYGEDFYDEVVTIDGIESKLLILISTKINDRGIYIQGYGDAEHHIDNSDIDSILDKIIPLISEDNFYEAFKLIIELINLYW